MEMQLPQDVRDGLNAARKAALLKSHRLRVEAADVSYRILQAWPGGFSVDASDASHLRGLVDLYDGARHLSQCLIVAASDEGGEWHFDYKRITAATDSPAVDFARAPDAAVGLLADLTIAARREV